MESWKKNNPDVMPGLKEQPETQSTVVDRLSTIVNRSRHCELGQTASAVAVESGADKEQSRHFTREQLDEMSRFQTIDIHTTRKIRTIKFGLVDSDSLHSFLT